MLSDNNQGGLRQATNIWMRLLLIGAACFAQVVFWGANQALAVDHTWEFENGEVFAHTQSTTVNPDSSLTPALTNSYALPRPAFTTSTTVTATLTEDILETNKLGQLVAIVNGESVPSLSTDYGVTWGSVIGTEGVCSTVSSGTSFTRLAMQANILPVADAIILSAGHNAPSGVTKPAVIRSTDSGENWNTCPQVIDDAGRSSGAIYFDAAQNRFILGTKNGSSSFGSQNFYYSSNGTSWTHLGSITGPNEVNAIIRSGGRLYAATDTTAGNSGLYYSDNNGSSWSAVSAGAGLTHNAVYALAVDDSGYVYATTSANYLLRITLPAGTQADKLTVSLDDASVSGARNISIVADQILVMTPGGDLVTSATGPGTTEVFQIEPAATGDPGVIDPGGGWYRATPIVNEAGPNIPSVVFTSPTNYSIHGFYYTGASTFTTAPAIATADGPEYEELTGFVEVAENSSAITYQLTNNGGANYYYWNGAAWAAAATPANSNSATVINANIASFTGTVGTGDLDWRAYMGAGAAIDSVTVSYLTEGITLTSPNGGEKWRIGESHDITWTHLGPVDEIDISLVIGGVPTPIATNVDVDDASYPWVVTNDPTEDAKILLEKSSDNSINVMSEEAFTIGTVTLTAPNGGVNLQVGTSYNITWDRDPVAMGGTVSISYDDDPGFGSPVVIIASTPNDGSYSWTVADAPAAAIYFRVAVTSDVESDIFDDSDASNIIDFITVDDPNGGESIDANSAYDILWDTDGFVGNVRILLSTDSGATFPTTIVASTDNDGLYNWVFTDGAFPSTMVRIRIELAADSNFGDESDEDFTVGTPPFITVQQPMSNSVWQVGTVKTITWTGLGLTNPLFDAEYSTTGGGGPWTPIATCTNIAIYSCSWTVPSVDSDDVFVRVTETLETGGAVSDMNNNAFIIGQITIAYPNGGERLLTNSPYPISWDRSDSLAGLPVNIYYSPDDGDIFALIASNEANDELYPSWTTPGTETDEGLIKISLASDDTFAAVSGDTFRLVEDIGGGGPSYPPLVVSDQTPEPDSHVGLDGDIRIVFSNPIVPPNYMEVIDLYLNDGGELIPVEDFTSWGKALGTTVQSNDTIILIPAQGRFELGATYRVEVKTDGSSTIQDVYGQNLSASEANEWEFYTVNPAVRFLSPEGDATLAINQPGNFVVHLVEDNNDGETYVAEEDIEIALEAKFNNLARQSGSFGGTMPCSADATKRCVEIEEGESEATFTYQDSEASTTPHVKLLAFSFPQNGWSSEVKTVIVTGTLNESNEYLELAPKPTKIDAGASTPAMTLASYRQSLLNGQKIYIPLPRTLLYFTTESATGQFYRMVGGTRSNLPSGGNYQYIDNTQGQFVSVAIYYTDTTPGVHTLTITDQAPAGEDVGHHDIYTTVTVTGAKILLPEEPLLEELIPVIDELDPTREIGSIVIDPDQLIVLPGQAKVIKATAYDTAGLPIPSVQFSWYVLAGDGVIEKHGIQTEGDVTIQALDSGTTIYTAGNQMGVFYDAIMVATLYNGKVSFSSIAVIVADAGTLPNLLPTTGVSNLRLILMGLTLLAAIALAWVEHYDKTLMARERKTQ